MQQLCSKSASVQNSFAGMTMSLVFAPPAGTEQFSESFAVARATRNPGFAYPAVSENFVNVNYVAAYRLHPLFLCGRSALLDTSRQPSFR
jgi:hypothetical protein